MIKQKTKFGHYLYQFGCSYPCGIILNGDPYEKESNWWGDRSKLIYGIGKIPKEDNKNKLIYE